MRTAAITLITLFCLKAFSQQDEKILPKSLNYKQIESAEPREIVLPAFSAKEWASLDYNDEKNGHMPKYARCIDTDISPRNSGTWTVIPGLGRIWRVKITSKNALALVPLFDSLYLPEGATLHVYMPDREETFGAFTHGNTPEPRAFCSGIIHGETCILEYFEPIQETGNGIIHINKVGHAYRWIEPLSKSVESGSGSCEVNTVCSEGDNWRNQIRSSVRISVVGNDGLGYCSGTLINNTLEDCTPYILSAEHCTEGGVTASEFNQWVFLFNYSSSTCAGTTGPTNQFVSGCKKVSESNDNNGDAGSDFLLLRLNTLPPSAYNVYYSGWDHSNTAATSGVGIHHPEGDITKISTFTHTATSQSWGDTVPNTHWQITWSNTSNGWGVSEPGSSGSAMYNQNGFVVGHLTGGNSCCTLNGCGIGSSPFGLDLFGKLAFDWASNGVTPEYQLGPWLDPENTGATTLSGMDPPCGGSIQYDAGMQAISLPGAEICGTTFNPVITIRNFGSNILTTIVISYFVDNGAIQQQQWTGTLNPGNTINVTLGQLTLSTGVHTIAVSTSLPNNHADNNTNNDLQILNFTVYPGTGNVNLFFSTDNKGSQSTWQITDGSNNIVASGGPFVDATGGRQYNYPLCLPSGCYKFTVFDSNSDGMHNGEDGDFSLTGPGGTPVYFSLGTPAFGAQEEHNFCIDATGINEVTPVEFSVTPNPSTGLFAIAFNTGESKTLKVFDAIGRLVNEKQFSGTNYQLNLSGQSKGVYLVAITSPRGTSVKKLVLE